MCGSQSKKDAMPATGWMSRLLLFTEVAAVLSLSTTPAPLNVAIAAARAAGSHLLSRVGAEPIATKLDAADLVTAVDKECEEIIGSHIREAFPSHALLGEESVEPGIDAAMTELATLQQRSEWLWIVDPIDGTTNFVSGMPLSAVSIGITRAGERMGAVVYDPFRDELFTAWRGEGALLNGDPMAASSVDHLSAAVLCACSPHRPAAMAPALRSIAAVMPRARSVRILGSGVLNFAWVACGRLGAYWQSGSSILSPLPSTQHTRNPLARPLHSMARNPLARPLHTTASTLLHGLNPLVQPLLPLHPSPQVRTGSRSSRRGTPPRGHC